jgi:hypothetical protein
MTRSTEMTNTISGPRKIGHGRCPAHNPNKEEYEVWQTSDGFFWRPTR